MNCEKIRELLSPFVDNMTSVEENEEIEAHIAICEYCMQEWQRIMVLCNMLGNLSNPKIPTNFSTQLRHRLLEG